MCWGCLLGVLPRHALRLLVEPHAQAGHAPTHLLVGFGGVDKHQLQRHHQAARLRLAARQPVHHRPIERGVVHRGHLAVAAEQPRRGGQEEPMARGQRVVEQRLRVALRRGARRAVCFIADEQVEPPAAPRQRLGHPLSGGVCAHHQRRGGGGGGLGEEALDLVGAGREVGAVGVRADRQHAAAHRAAAPHLPLVHRLGDEGQRGRQHEHDVQRAARVHGLGDAQREHRLARAARQDHRCAAAPAAATAAAALSQAAALTATEEGLHHGLGGLPLHRALGRLRALGRAEILVGGGAPQGSGHALLQKRRRQEQERGLGWPPARAAGRGHGGARPR